MYIITYLCLLAIVEALAFIAIEGSAKRLVKAYNNTANQTLSSPATELVPGGAPRYLSRRRLGFGSFALRSLVFGASGHLIRGESLREFSCRFLTEFGYDTESGESLDGDGPRSTLGMLGVYALPVAVGILLLLEAIDLSVFGIALELAGMMLAAVLYLWYGLQRDRNTAARCHAAAKFLSQLS